MSSRICCYTPIIIYDMIGQVLTIICCDDEDKNRDKTFFMGRKGERGVHIRSGGSRTTFWQ